MSKITLVIPIYNEEAILEKNTKVFKEYMDGLKLEDYEILLVENGSKDKTLEIAKKLEDKHTRVISLPEPTWGGAIIRGFKEAKYDPAIYSIDLGFNLDFIARSLEKIGDYQMVLGSRYIENAKIKRPAARTIISKPHAFLMRILFGTTYSDFDAVKLFRKDVATTLADEVVATSSFFETELLYLAKKHGYTFIQIPVDHCELKRESKFNFKRLVIDFLIDFTKNYWRLKRKKV